MSNASSGQSAEMVRHLYQRGRRAWPQLPVTLEQFSAHVGPHLARLQPGAAEKLFAEDLFLACACAQGCAAALATFDRLHLAWALAPLAARAELRGGLDETRQSLREQLLVAAPGRAPRILQYSGRGPLRAWLRAVAVRAGREQLMRDLKHAPGGLDEEVPLLGADPELDLMRSRFRQDFSAAFRAALEALGAQERNVLRLHLIERLSIDQLGEVFGTHRSTAARWLARAREELLAGTQQRLAQTLRLDRTELDSLMRQLRSQMDVSIISFLRRSTHQP